MVVVIIRIARDLGSRLWALTLGLLVGGAVGNLIDRLFREPGFARGHVVDFFQLPHWPIFNIADSCIFCAALLIGWLGLRGIGVNGERAGGPEEQADVAPSAGSDPASRARHERHPSPAGARRPRRRARRRRASPGSSASPAR